MHISNHFRQLLQGTATEVAVFRIVLIASILWLLHPSRAIEMAGYDPSLIVAPYGYDTFIERIPINPQFATLMTMAFITSCWSALIGFRTKISLLIAAITGAYVLGIPQMFGKISHIHHVIWMLLLLAASPSGDTLSLDCKLKKGTWHSLSTGTRFGLTITLLWALYGIIYFFPGAWKLSVDGFAWADSERMTALLHGKWIEPGAFEPLFRLDQYPRLLSVIGTAVLLFEIGALLPIFSRKLRTPFIVAAVAFHAGTWAFMDIDFMILWIPLLPLALPTVLKRLGNYPSNDPLLFNQQSLISLTVGSMLVYVNFYCGFYYIDTWPFGTYPAFAGEPHDSFVTLEIRTRTETGENIMNTEIGNAAFGGSANWVTVQRRLIASDNETDCMNAWSVLSHKNQALRNSDFVTMTAVQKRLNVDSPDILSTRVICAFAPGELGPVYAE